jgi:hypothetical protein
MTEILNGDEDFSLAFSLAYTRTVFHRARLDLLGRGAENGRYKPKIGDIVW